MNRHSADLVGAPVEPTRLVARDLASEVIAAIVAKPGRSFLTTLGTVLGVGTLIVILGLTSTASGQVSARFDAQAATTVTVKDARNPEGYFSRSLHVYGRQGQPCDRCGTFIVRESFMNRGSHFCPRCQRLR